MKEQRPGFLFWLLAAALLLAVSATGVYFGEFFG